MLNSPFSAFIITSSSSVRLVTFVIISGRSIRFPLNSKWVIISLIPSCAVIPRSARISAVSLFSCFLNFSVSLKRYCAIWSATSICVAADIHCSPGDKLTSSTKGPLIPSIMSTAHTPIPIDCDAFTAIFFECSSSKIASPIPPA